MGAGEAGDGGLKGGELNAAISNALVKIHIDYVGRGPKRVQTFHRDNIVVALFEESMTKAERSLADAGRGEAVRRMRHELQGTMTDDMIRVVEEVTGRSVVAFMSANHLDPDLASEMFVLDAPIATREPKGDADSVGAPR